MSIHSFFRSVNVFAARASALAVISTAALAHPGHGSPGTALFAGLSHPMTGLDHLYAMLAVGLWSALAHTTIRTALWTPISFLCLLLTGSLLGSTGVFLPFIEPMIMASLLVLGLLVASRASLPSWAGMALIGFFALFHGLAHGSELPVGSNAAAFIAGFMMSTFALHVVGLAAGLTLKRRTSWLTRLAGAGIAFYGVSLFAS